MVGIGLVGLVVGAILRVLVPYVRGGLEAVAESGTLSVWPKFDYRYLALITLPLLEYSVAFLTLPGVFDAMLSWGFIPAVALGHSGAALGKEVIQAAAAVYSFVKKRA